ncbi:MAG: porin family protein [Calditrichaeota bacterium]|nr:porin family protein [Calditrichota bacterium]
MQRILAGIFVLMVILYLPVQAQGLGLGKVYVGGSIGSSFVETKPQDLGGEQLKLDANGFAYRFYAGVKLLQFIGAEAGYRNLGTLKNTVQNIEIETDISGFDIFARAGYSFIMAEVFAKAGYFFWNSKVSGAGITVEDDDKDFGWGIGAALNLGKLGIRAEWESFSLEDMDKVSMLTAGVVYYIM